MRRRATLISLLTACALSWPIAAHHAGRPAQAAAQTPASAVKLAEALDQRFTRGDVTIRYREVGQGPAVLMVHGYSGNLASWFGFADLLSPSHRVIAVDVRGFGQSSKFADAAKFGEPMADDLVHLLDHLKIERAHLIGHSMGALIAANVAARYPSRVATAALVAGPFYADRATFVREAAPWIKDLESGQGLLNFFAWLFPKMDPKTAAMANTQALKTNDLASLIAVLRALPDLVVPPARALAVPALVTAGTGDPLHPLSVALARGSKARLLEIEDADHISILRSQEMLGAIRALLRP
jgi:pimeloyl-ACP methyl ester carboxylesterase